VSAASQITVQSPLGPLTLMATTAGLREIRFGASPAVRRDDGTLRQVARQLDEYFRGERRRFDLPLDLRGTPFQVEVWQALAEIPFGTTSSYGDHARRLGRPRATRAVGAANGSNPLPIVLPCHRLVGSDGSLTGYGGGLDAKRWLLEFEAGVAETGSSRLWTD
jgi:methylated-DNA-[protein]-cysteine S-methyltransferase